MISYMLDIELRDKEALLAQTDVHRRAELLLTHLAVSAAGPPHPQWDEMVFPPQFSVN